MVPILPNDCCRSWTSCRRKKPSGCWPARPEPSAHEHARPAVSYAQERMWFLNQSGSGTTLYSCESGSENTCRSHEHIHHLNPDPRSTMKLENRTIHMPLAEQGAWLSTLSRTVAQQLGEGAYPLRLSIAKVGEQTAVVEVTVLSLSDEEARRHGIEGAALLAPRRKEWQAGPFAV